MIPQRHRHQLFLNASFFISRIRPLLRPQRKLILHLPRDPLLRSIQLCGVRHIRPAIRIEQRHHQRIFQLPARRQRKSVAPANHKRRLRHRLHPARQHNLRLVGLDHLRRRHNRLHPRPAQPVHRQRRSLNRHPRPQPHVPRPIQRVARSLLRVAKHRVIEFLGIDPRALDRSLRRNRAQLLRGKILQFAAIAAKGRTRPTDNGDVTWFQHDFPGRTPARTDQNRSAKLVSLAAAKQI